MQILRWAASYYAGADLRLVGNGGCDGPRRPLSFQVEVRCEGSMREALICCCVCSCVFLITKEIDSEQQCVVKAVDLRQAITSSVVFHLSTVHHHTAGASEAHNVLNPHVRSSVIRCNTTLFCKA